MKKSIISMFTVLALCVSLLSPVASTTSFAQEAANTVTVDNEKSIQKDADDAVLGKEIELKHWSEDLDDNAFWTYEINLDKSSMVYFNITTSETLDAKFHMTLVENESGKPLIDTNDFVNDDTDYFDAIGLDPGTYTLTFTNTSPYYMYYNFVLSYSRFYTVDDPLYSLNKEKLTIYKGKTSQLKAKALPESATYESVTWSSSNTSVATVNQNGLVTAKAKGTATITADIDGQLCTCTVTVKNPTYSSLNYKSLTLYVKKTKQLKLSVTPENYGLDGLKWKSSNTKVATVSSKGLVTAKAKGTATITATVNGVSRTCKVTVKPMTLNKSSATVYVKKTQQLKVYGGTGTVSWKSSNTKVATVNSKGVVKGVKPGTATITATKNGKKMTCKVTIKWEPETGTTTTKKYKISYSGDYDIVMKGPGKLTFTITNTDSGDYADNLDLSLSNPDFKDILEVSVAPGKTKTVSVNTTKKGTFYLYCYGYGTVTMKKTTKPTITKSSMNVGRGYTKSLSVVGVKNGGTWSSSNKSIATVSSKGVIKGKKNGTCYIKYTLKTGKVLKCKVKVVNPVTCSVSYVSEAAIYNDCGVKFTNYTNKKITYIKLNIKQYDNKGSRLYDGPYDWYYVNDTLPANSYDVWEFWVSDDAKKCTAYITKVYFADGTTWKP